MRSIEVILIMKSLKRCLRQKWNSNFLTSKEECKKNPRSWAVMADRNIKGYLKNSNVFKSVVQHCCSPYWNVVKFKNDMQIWVIRVISNESKSACFTWFLWYFKVIFSYFNSIILKCRLKTLQKELTNDFFLYFYILDFDYNDC